METRNPTETAQQHMRSERVVEQTITLFRGGYMLSFALVAIGLLIALIRDMPLTSELGPPAELLEHVLDGDPSGFIGLGIGVMIMTPIVMTVEVAINFFRANDSRFAMITSIVAAILIATLALAFV